MDCCASSSLFVQCENNVDKDSASLQLLSVHCIVRPVGKTLDGQMPLLR